MGRDTNRVAAVEQGPEREWGPEGAEGVSRVREEVLDEVENAEEAGARDAPYDAPTSLAFL
jgi:hypothetical protein